VTAGARVDLVHFAKFCLASPDDGVCRPQLEFAVTAANQTNLLKRPEMQAEADNASADHAISEVRAAFVMAPALVQALEPASLARMRTPVGIILGDADTVAPPATNGTIAAKNVPNASLIQLRAVGHYDFLATCTQNGRAIVPLCKASVPQDDTHRRAIEAAKAFFGRQLGTVH
jgi:predicted dienelactone hydrolase